MYYVFFVSFVYTRNWPIYGYRYVYLVTYIKIKDQ